MQNWSRAPLPAALAVPGLGSAKSLSVLEVAVWDLLARLTGAWPDQLGLSSLNLKRQSLVLDIASDAEPKLPSTNLDLPPSIPPEGSEVFRCKYRCSPRVCQCVCMSLCLWLS